MFGSIRATTSAGAGREGDAVRRTVDGVDPGGSGKDDANQADDHEDPAAARPQLAAEAGPAGAGHGLDPVERDAPGNALELLRSKPGVGVGQERPGQRPDGVGDQDLAGPGLGAHPGGDVDRAPDQTLGRGHGLPGMDPDPDPDRLCLGARLGRGGDERQAGLDRARGGRKDDVDAVALGLDLGPGVGGDRGPDEGPVRIEQVGRRPVAVRLDERAVAPEVAEQEALRTGTVDGHA